MKTKLILAAGVVAAVTAGGSASALVASPSLKVATTGGNGDTSGIHDTKKTQSKDCINSVTGQREGTFTYNGPEYVWPPNHKYRNADISLTDDDGDLNNASTVAVVGSNDETVQDGADYTEMNGAGNTDPATDSPPSAGEGDPTATAHQQFRGERSGRGDGRTYKFTVNGTTDGGTTTCNPVTFTSFVPHDQSDHTNSGPKKSSKKSARKRSARR
jgi:hypothetical protein